MPHSKKPDRDKLAKELGKLFNRKMDIQINPKINHLKSDGLIANTERLAPFSLSF